MSGRSGRHGGWYSGGDLDRAFSTSRLPGTHAVTLLTFPGSLGSSTGLAQKPFAGRPPGPAAGPDGTRLPSMGFQRTSIRGIYGSLVPYRLCARSVRTTYVFRSGGESESGRRRLPPRWGDRLRCLLDVSDGGQVRAAAHVLLRRSLHTLASSALFREAVSSGGASEAASFSFGGWGCSPVGGGSGGSTASNSSPSDVAIENSSGRWPSAERPSFGGALDEASCILHPSPRVAPYPDQSVEFG